MPSGGHGGGGGGSHFSGGSHYSGGHYGGYRRPIVPIIIGRRYYMNKGCSTKYTNIKSFGIFLLVVAIFAGLITLASNSNIKEIKADHDRYIEMIDYATEHPEYQKTGYVTATVFNDDVDKYYYTYKIQRDDDPSKWLDDGYTYCLYTFYTIQDIEVGDAVVFACDSSTVTANTDSINMDYKNFTLADDGEFVSAYKAFNTFKIIGMVLGGIGACLIFYSFIYRSKNKKERIANEHVPEGYKACPYCGNTVSVNAKKCDNCGVEY